MNADDILNFWYSEPMKKNWFKATAEIDQQIRQRFESSWQQAAKGELDHWKVSADSCLALIILLDQMPLNMFRGEALSFSTEADAVAATLYGLQQAYDEQLEAGRLAFFYMPLMHSESLQHQDLAVEKFSARNMQDNLRFAKHHRELIRQFGRFPHRNAILNRESTPQELEYLNSKQAFKG